MMKLPRDFKEFIELLNSHEVRYLIVGGYAVAYHGHPRATGDIDVFIDASEDNARRVEKVLDAFGFASLGLTYRDFLTSGTIIQLGFPPNRIDIITSLSGTTFAEAWEDRVNDTFHGVVMTLIGRKSLLINKAASDRAKDRADLETLS